MTVEHIGGKANYGDAVASLSGKNAPPASEGMSTVALLPMVGGINVKLEPPYMGKPAVPAGQAAPDGVGEKDGADKKGAPEGGAKYSVGGSVQKKALKELAGERGLSKKQKDALKRVKATDVNRGLASKYLEGTLSAQRFLNHIFSPNP